MFGTFHGPGHPRFSIFQPPEASPPRLLVAALLPLACLLLVLAFVTFGLAVWLCDFAVAYFYPIGELLSLFLFAHSHRALVDAPSHLVLAASHGPSRPSLAAGPGRP